MSDAIIVALISGGVTLLGTVATVLITASRQTQEMGLQMAVIDERISTLRHSVEAHNNFARRMPVVEEQIKVINHRLDDIESENARYHRKDVV